MPLKISLDQVIQGAATAGADEDFLRSGDGGGFGQKFSGVFAVPILDSGTPEGLPFQPEVIA